MIKIIAIPRTKVPVTYAKTKIGNYYLIKDRDLIPCLVHRVKEGIIEISDEYELEYVPTSLCRTDKVFCHVDVKMTVEITS